MRRRHYNSLLDEPQTGGVQPLFALGLGLACCALLLLVAAGGGTRLGAWSFRTGFTLVRVAAYGGIGALLVTLVAIGAALGQGAPIRKAWVLVAGGMALIAVALPLSWKRAAAELPRIHDISTDLDNPPRFVAILPLRLSTDNPADYGGEEIAAQQRQAYGDVKPLVLDTSVDQAFALALKAAQRMCWRIAAQVPEEGRIEATATTFWFGFKDDIVIRITPLENRARLDIRSLSRVGVSDVGTNANRIRAFLRELTSLKS